MRKSQTMRSSCCLGAALAAVAVSAVGAGLSSAAGTASKSSVATGSYAIVTDFFSPLSSGKDAEILSLKYKGGLAGVAIDNGTHTFNPTTTAFSARGTEYCAACTLGGKSGAYIATFTYSGSGNTYSGRLTFTRGFGKLTRLKGGGTFKGVVSTNTNTYRYHYTLR